MYSLDKHFKALTLLLASGQAEDAVEHKMKPAPSSMEAQGDALN